MGFEKKQEAEKDEEGKMILGLIIILGLITGTLYCCLVVASRYDDMMGYDEYYDDQSK